MNYYLVDGENVNAEKTINVAKEKVKPEDMMIIFRTCKSDGVYKKVDYLKEKINCNILTIDVLNGGKNSLDFQLVSYLGLLIGDNKAKGLACNYNIISNDHGYLSTINLLTNCANVEVELITPNAPNTKLRNRIQSRKIKRKNANIISNIIENNTTKKGIKRDFEKCFNSKAAIEFYNKCLPIIDKYLASLEG